MKNLLAVTHLENKSFINLFPEGPEAAEQVNAAPDEAEIDPRQIAREGMRGVNDELAHIGTLSPEANQIVGAQLPDMIQAGITSPEDARHLGEAAAGARANIEASLNEDDPAASEYPPEAYAEVTAWLEEVEAQMAAAQTALAAQAEEHPENVELQRQMTAFNGMVDEVRAFSDEARDDLAILQERALEGGVTGPLGERLAQLAEGEVGQVNSDAEGNQRYTPGAVDQPWCADFVNAMLEEAGGQGTGSSMAQSFVQGEGKGHVAIVTQADGNTVGGNEGNAVRAGGNAAEFEHAISAEAVSEGRFEERKDASQAQVGDIVVRSRDEGPGASAADQNVA